MKNNKGNFSLNRERLSSVVKLFTGVIDSWRIAVRQRAAANPHGVNLVAPDPSIAGLSQFFNLFENEIQNEKFKTEKFVLGAKNFKTFAKNKIISMYPCTVAVINAGLIPIAAFQFPRIFSKSKKRIGVWFWELEEIPKLHLFAKYFLDEVWVPSTFMYEAYQKANLDLPIKIWPVPLPILNENGKGKFRNYLELEEDVFIFGYVCDIGSSPERKNPEALLDAYLFAFPQESEKLKLVLKITRGNNFPNVLADLIKKAENRSDIKIVTDFLSEEIMDGFFLDVNCYVSPHRSEGLGLTIYSAISAGANVIATGYSGCMDILNKTRFKTIPFQLKTIGPNPVYPENSFWADPDVNELSKLMIDAYRNSEMWAHVAQDAQSCLKAELTRENLRNWISNQISNKSN